MMGEPNGQDLKAALRVVRQVDEHFESNERLRLGKWLLPDEREQTIARIIAAALSRREDAVRAEIWKAAIKAAHANLNASSSGTADYVSGFANGVLSGAQQTIKALEAVAGSKTKVVDEQKNQGR